MKSFTIHDFNTWEEYASFMRYMIAKSDRFSLVYFKYTEEEKWLQTVERVYNTLKPYIVYEKAVDKWPGTVTLNENNHIYNMVVYKSVSEVEEALLLAFSLYAWDYPILPMDLCFYINGYAWFELCAHERWNRLIVDRNSVVKDLLNMGVGLVQNNDVDESELFKLM